MTGVRSWIAHQFMEPLPVGRSQVKRLGGAHRVALLH
jgi:hypothetical protein